jgi:ElaA protein
MRLAAARGKVAAPGRRRGGSAYAARMPSYDVHVDGFDDLDARTAYLLWQLRESVFVVEQRCPYPELDGRDLEPGTRHVWVAADGVPVAYLRVLDEGDHLRIGRVLVARGHRGTGLSATLMRVALDVVGERPSRLDAQAPLAGWYATFGYQAVGEEFLDDGIPHVPMARVGG